MSLGERNVRVLAFLVFTLFLPSCVWKEKYDEFAKNLDVAQRDFEELKAELAERRAEQAPLLEKNKQLAAELKAMRDAVPDYEDEAFNAATALPKKVAELKARKAQAIALHAEYSEFKDRQRAKRLAGSIVTEYPEITTTDGKTYKGVSIKSITSAGVTLTHDSGMGTIPSQLLPDEVREKMQFLEPHMPVPPVPDAVMNPTPIPGGSTVGISSRPMFGVAIEELQSEILALERSASLAFGKADALDAQIPIVEAQIETFREYNLNGTIRRSAAYQKKQIDIFHIKIANLRATALSFRNSGDEALRNIESFRKRIADLEATTPGTVRDR